MPDSFNPDILGSEPSSSSSASGSESTSSAATATLERSSGAQRPTDQSIDRKEGEGTKGNKHPGAYERAKARVKQREAQAQQRENSLRQREAQLAQREQALQPQAKQRDYTLKELKKYYKQWSNPNHREYNPEVAEKAEAEIELMEAEEAGAQRPQDSVPTPGSPEHTRQWQQAEAQLAKDDPDFLKEGTLLDAKVREIMAGPDGNQYRRYPLGIFAVYDRAVKELLQQDIGELAAKNQELEKELRRYQGLTGVGSGSIRGPSATNGQVNSISDFSRLSTADMKKHLLRQAGRTAEAEPHFIQ